MVLQTAAELRVGVEAGTEATWHFCLGFGLSVTGMLVVLVGMALRMNLLVLGLASLILIAGMIQLSFWSRLRRCWL